IDGEDLAAFEQAHQAWLAFRERHARFVSQSYSSGPIRPLIYAVTMESLTVAWINELETQLGEDEAG
ncbi:lysozyme inhibitor LprI family protein, partial [Lysobacter sp. 2RAB21]